MLCCIRGSAQNNSNSQSICVGSVVENNSTSLVKIPGCEITVTNNTGKITLFSDSLGNFQFPLDSNSTYIIKGKSDIKYTQGDIFRKGKYRYFSSKPLLISTVGLTTSKYFECIIRLDTSRGCHSYPYVEFENNTSKLTNESKILLNDLIEILNENPTFSIEIKSFADYKGSIEFNQKLSQERANAALEYLIDKGIDKNRVWAKGYGETSPKIITTENFMFIPMKYHNDFPIGSVLDEKFIESLKTAELKEVALQLNRRTEFQVLCTDWSTGKTSNHCLIK